MYVSINIACTVPAADYYRKSTLPSVRHINVILSTHAHNNTDH